MKEILTFVATCINLEGIMLGEKRQAEKRQIWYNLTYICRIKKAKPHRNRE